jgi:cytochrome c biogenesis protein CcmG/thiol:disulfide interchange protein DsbE
MEMHKQDQSAQWVDERLAELAPPANWQPDKTSALGRFRSGRESRTVAPPRWMWATAVCAASVTACALAFPSSRVFAQRCVNACVAETGFVAASLIGRLHSEPISELRPAAPDFQLQDSGGNTLRLSDLKGQVVLLNFWATWCRPCTVEIPWFTEFQREYRDAGLAVLGVSMDDDGWASVKPFMADHKINYRVALGNDDITRAFGAVESLPATVMIDKAGRVAATHVGLVEKKTYEQELRKLLAER